MDFKVGKCKCGSTDFFRVGLGLHCLKCGKRVKSYLQGTPRFEESPEDYIDRQDLIHVCSACVSPGISAEYDAGFMAGIQRAIDLICFAEGFHYKEVADNES